MKGKIRFKGGAGSGNFGHSGRPGKVGGSGGAGGGGNSDVVARLLDAHPGIFANTSNEAYVAATQLVRDLKEQSRELGLYNEITHWTGSATADEYNSFVGVQNYRAKPEWVPENVQNQTFTNNNLPRYYAQETGRGNTMPVELFKRALSGEFGENHQKATALIQELSQEAYRRKFGAVGVLFRGGSKMGMSYSESKSVASRAAGLLHKNDVVYEVSVPANAILFGEIVIPSPYPEKEWVVNTSLISG